MTLFTDINECASDPCQNDGTCTDQVNAYICTCDLGYTGVHCEIGIFIYRHRNLKKDVKMTHNSQ